MARTITQILDSAKAAYVVERQSAGLPYDNPTLWSIYNLKRLIFYIVAYTVYGLEVLQDIFRSDVNTALLNLKPHTAKWYANKGLAYLHGVPLLPDSDQYNTTGYTDAQLIAAKVVKHAAVIEQTNQYGRISLRVKLAREVSTALAALTVAQLAGVKAYFARIKDAGVRLQIDSLPADGLKLAVKVFYDPQLLDANGARLDGTDLEPVQNAIRAYLKDLPFNGLLVLAKLTDAMQAVPGVVIPEITGASAQYGAFPYLAIATEYNPDAGYLKFYNEPLDLQLTFIPHNPI